MLGERVGASEPQDCIIFTIKEWNLQEAERLGRAYPQHRFFVFSKPEDLNERTIEKINPRYIFFPHWSWVIPDSVLERWECVIFHLGDVPHGRGGSPLQNHIQRKIYTTSISALRATRGIDEGPVYCKKEISLYGGAEEIFLRLSQLVFREVIPYILENNPESQEQKGEGTFFPRRKAEQSDFAENDLKSLDDLFDLIRMLDVEGYPKAYLDYGPFRLTFGRAQRKYGKVIADVEITMQGGEME
jgi:methionyl-tRNA formyltransferase